MTCPNPPWWNPGMDDLHDLFRTHPRADLREFAEHLIALGRSPETVRTYVYGLLRVERARGKPIQEIDSKDMIAFRLAVDNLGCRRPMTTTEITICAVRAFHLFGVERGYWEMNGLMAVVSPKRVRRPSKWLPEAQAKELLDACSSSDERRLCYLPLYAGCRISEAAAMGPAHRISEDRLEFEGKGRKWREVPIHPLLEDCLEDIFSRPWDRWSRSYHIHSNRRLTRRTGIDFHPHMLRASFAHALEEADVEHDVRAALLGHGHTLTMSYSGVSWRRKVDAISRLHY